MNSMRDLFVRTTIFPSNEPKLDHFYSKNDNFRKRLNERNNNVGNILVIEDIFWCDCHLTTKYMTSESAKFY